MTRQIRIRTGHELTAAVGEVRRSQGLTQQELADIAGLARSYLAQIEVGRTSSVIEHALRALRRMGATVTVTYDPLEPGAGAPVDDGVERGTSGAA